MFLMLAVWVVVLVGVALKARWTIPLGFANLVVTAWVLHLHITSAIPLNF